MTKQEYMEYAIILAQQGRGWTSPNPMVGAVIVKNGVIIGSGYHERCGGLHAERNALKACTESPEGADVYVTLEPCCHTGRTPPCTDALIAAKVRRVIIGSRDPNPKVAGNGAMVLREHGIEVEEDFMREACDQINPIFFHYITQRMPYVAIKYAMTADGKIATRTGASQWITGEPARAHVHSLRHAYRAILVGSGTLLRDDPLLNCRMEHGRNPIRVICDARLRIAPESQICRTAGTIETIVATHAPNPEKKAVLEALGITVLDIPLLDGSLHLRVLMEALGQREIDSVLVEGGGAIHGAILQAGLAQKIYCYLAPKIFGGTDAKSPIGGLGVAEPGAAVRLSKPELTQFEDGDLLLAYEVEAENVYGNH
ncbi:MAG: bifunctional diaminohydroxyphosphoribosylaminopyrimidine deaminase/5-amino-6-(5-phosphoribosylamino)uracil reductase RibD [Evtepia sp.]